LKKDINFISIVYLGNFNPAILNKDFLEKYGIIEFVEEPVIKPTPFFTNIVYRNLKFINDLERFQITEEKINNFKNNSVIKLSNEYLKILNHTPLKAMGINFNVNLKLDSLDKFTGRIKTKEIFNFFKIKKIILKNEIIYEEGIEKNNSANLIIPLKKDKIIQINIQNINEGLFQLNYNFEIRELEKNLKNRDYIKDNFDKILDNYSKILDFLF
jgi:hypothetical protein